MRRSTTSCRPPRPEPRRRRGARLPLAVLPLLLAGCVSLGTHRAVVKERDHLKDELSLAQQRVHLLEASNESLSNEREKLIGEVEDLRTARQKLGEQVDALEAHRKELQENLGKRETEVKSLRSTYDGLVHDLQSEVADGRVQIEQLSEGLRVKLAQDVLFPSGSAQLSAEGRSVIARVAARLKKVDQRVEVQGHTDDVPISGALASRYPSNWELAGARAASVVRVLQQNGVPSDRLVAVSFGDTRPVASNDSADGRARNRRIEIRLRPIKSEGDAGAKDEPEAPAAPGG